MRRILVLVVLVALMLAGCGPNADPALQPLLDSMADGPYYSPAPASDADRCMGALNTTDGFNVEVVGMIIKRSADGSALTVSNFSFIYRAIGANLPPYAQLGDQFAPATSFTNMKDVFDCLYKHKLGTVPSDNIVPSPVATFTPVPTAVVPIAIPQMETTYVWVKPDGTTQTFADEASARAAASKSWEGGTVQKITTLGGVQFGDPEIVVTYPAFTTPKGPDGQAIVLPNASADYYVDELTGFAFATLEDAVAFAKSRNDAADIHLKNRGTDMGEAQQIAAFTPEQVLTADNQHTTVDATTPYIKVTVTQPDGTSFSTNFAQDAMDKAEEFALMQPGSSSIDIYQRGLPQEHVKTIDPWTAPPELDSAFGGKFPNLAQEYWTFVEPTGTRMFFMQSLADARLFGETYNEGTPCVFPGGTIRPYIRNLPQAESEQIPAWTCPADLPQDWKPLDTYYSRGGRNFTTVYDAATADLWPWLFGQEQEILAFRRGVQLTDGEPIVNWWAPYSLYCCGSILLIPLLLWLIRLWAKNRHKPKKEKPPKKDSVPEALKNLPRLEVDTPDALMFSLPLLKRALINIVVVIVTICVAGAFLLGLQFLASYIISENVSGNPLPLVLLILLIVLSFLFGIFLRKAIVNRYLDIKDAYLRKIRQLTSPQSKEKE